MLKKQALRQILVRAASLLAVVALVLALFQAGPTAMAASVVAHVAVPTHDTPSSEDCAHHAAQHAAQHHHAHISVLSDDAGVEHDHGASQQDPAHQHHSHPCCMSAVSIVLPVLASVPLPVFSGGPKVMGDEAERLEKRAPEGPNEPPRTASIA